MSYEFNPESQVFEFPNPYKVQNLAIIISGAFMVLAGAATMLIVRDRIAHGLDGRALAVVGISIFLLLFGIGLLARAFTRLRYFFGRNRPDNLAPVVGTDQDGDSKIAGIFKETLRQNAITFREPKGPLNGLLYSWLPHLIFAPDVIQRTAQTQFYNFLALATTFVSFLLCWFVFGQGPANGWIGLGYGAFAFLQIMRPMVKQSGPAATPVTDAANVGTGSLIVLIVLAVLGPVILGVAASHLPDLDGLSINGVVLVALVCALIGCGVFGLALKNQLRPSPQTVGSARVTETVTMNAHPNKLIEELDRILMSRWYSRIPNRRYARRSPVISGQQGPFGAEIFEETQPRPQPDRIATGVGHALSMPQFFWLTCLTGLAMIYLIAGTIATVLITRDILGGEPIATITAFAVSQMVVGMFCYGAAHVLWGRFDFVSELIWVNINGSFESAQVHIGNQLSGNVQTTKTVINTESMTMRVWVSEIDTVIFGKDAARQLIGMRGLQNIADELAAGLKGFGETRSMVVAPTSNQDFERAQKIGMMHKVIAGSKPNVPDERLAAALIATGTKSNIVTPDIAEDDFLQRNFCTHCGAGADPDASYCGECGKPTAS
ncbi:zinc ribbon domain-containing protein [Collimonas antrihumi]|uniref:zinc ribbon domain-containing protein n=1 Tax=Collimonas antrihumi TaxID=1940615 RepID=UPI001B8D16D9|nr:zinc ribbon domain-containing protein [Collimonas antrihumi]